MSLLATIDSEARARGLRYLIIGGYAVIAHGYPRLTFDFDIAIERARRKEWLELAGGLGYSVYHDGGAFLQLDSASTSWPLDLMLLNESTFAKLSGALIHKDFEGLSLPVVSLLHLIAMKVHALRNTRARRFLKDFEDVAELIVRNKLDLDSPEIQEIFQRYGTPELLDKIRNAASPS